MVITMLLAPWRILIRPSKRVRPGKTVLDGSARVRVVGRSETIVMTNQEGWMHRFWAGGKHSPTVGRIAILSAILSVVPGCGADNSGGGVQAPLTQASGTVTGLVVSSANNAPVSGATVRTDSSATTTATDGTFNVLAPAGDRTIVRVEANGFADALPIAHVTEGQISTLGIRLVPIGFTTTVSVEAGGTVSVPNSTARVTIPGNSLVDRKSVV